MYLMASPRRARPVRQGDRAERLHDLDARAAERDVRRRRRRGGRRVWLAGKLGASDLAGLRAMDAAALTDAAARAGYLPVRHDRRPRAAAPARRRVRSRRAGAGADPRGLQQRRDPLAALPRCRRRRPMRRPTRQQIRERYARSRRRVPRSSIRRAIWRRACSRRRATRCTAGRPSGWSRKQTAAGAPSFLYYFDHGYPAADAHGPARLPRQRAPLRVRHGRARRRRSGRRSPTTPVETQLSDAMVELLGRVRARRRAERSRPAAVAGLRHASVRTWPSKTRRGRRRICCPACTSCNEQVVCRRRASGGIPWNWNVGLASPPLPAEAPQCR